MYSLYPDEFITKFLAFISIFGLKGRIVFGLDFAFTGLEQKFRVKAFPKNLDKNTSGDKMEEESRIQPEVDSKSLMSNIDKIIYKTPFLSIINYLNLMRNGSQRILSNSFLIKSRNLRASINLLFPGRRNKINQ